MFRISHTLIYAQKLKKKKMERAHDMNHNNLINLHSFDVITLGIVKKLIFQIIELNYY